MRFQWDPVDGELLHIWLKPAKMEPEKELMLAVLESAIEDFQKYAFARGHRGRMLFENAEQWILEKDNDWFLSFESICETFSLDANYLRRGLLRWREAQRSRLQKSNAA